MCCQDGVLGGGVKLDSMMEQLQRQQHERLEMQHKERLLRESHIMYAQQVAAQHAILAAARASGAGFTSMGTAGALGHGLPSQVSNQSSMDSDREDERGRDSGEEDHEMMEGDEDSEEDDRPPGALEYLRNQTLALQRGAGGPFGNFADAKAAQRAPSPPVRVKEEPEDELSPTERPDASSPNARSDWSYEQHFKVVRKALSSCISYHQSTCQCDRTQFTSFLLESFHR